MQEWNGPSNSGQRPGVSFGEKSNELLGSVNDDFLSSILCWMLSGLW